MKRYRKLIGGLVIFMAAITLQNAAAETLSSPSLAIDTETTGVDPASVKYDLAVVDGEAKVGNAAFGSHKLAYGYVTELKNGMQIELKPNGLTAYYPLDEGDGTTVHDTTTNSVDIPFNGSPTWDRVGQVNGAMSGFTATDSVRSTHNEVLNTSNITVSAWVKSGSAVSNANTVARWLPSSSDDGEWALGQGTGTTFQFKARINGAARFVTGPIPSHTNYHHVVGTYDGSNLKLYVDGVLADTEAISGSLATNSRGLSIGASDDGSNAWPGAIDEVKIFNHALNLDEIRAEYNAQKAGIASGLRLGTVVAPDTSRTADYDAVVLTDAANYSLLVDQDHDLKSGANTLGAISGTINSPVSWADGVTKGLGFTLKSAPNLDGKWTNGRSFAAFPNTNTSFYSHYGLVGVTKDIIDMQMRADTPVSQVPGAYSNVITITGTYTP